MTPRVAVVIPVWGSYIGFLGEALASVREQDESVEVIVVDNASDERPPPLPGVNIVRAPSRLSTGAARNLGLGAVTAPLVVFLDADDVMLPGSLRALKTGIRDGDAAFAMAIIEGDTGMRHRAPRSIAYTLARVPPLFALANTIWSLLPTQGATIMRTAAVRAAGGYADSSQGEDWALGSALAWRGRIRLGTEPALLYRWRFDSPGQAGANPDLLANARRVRERMRTDAAVPAVVRALLPLLAGVQWLAVAALRPLVLGARRVRG